jgi:tRNA U34 5-methylaminomethyl-2-thiouridine-forming methyltransferase MnmC
MLTRQIVHTEDGSSSIFLPELNEHYHSFHGAIQESKYVFINQGFDLALNSFDQLNVFEVGLGTGLNCLLTLQRSIILNKNVLYTAIEPYPLSDEEWGSLNYPQMITGQNLKEVFSLIHNSEFGIEVNLSVNFKMIKLQQTLQTVALPEDIFHLVYFDAFCPQVQPELWSKEIFEKIAQSMKIGGLLVTYSAKGIVKRALKECGFVLEHPAGPPGKREMTRALKVS